VQHWLVTGYFWSWRNYFHFAKGDFSDFIMKERLDDSSESIVANFRDNIPKLIARHECQQVVPILQWK
jgi:hypothetical protein